MKISTWFSSENQLIISWKSPVSHLIVTWLSGDTQLICTWKSCWYLHLLLFIIIIYYCPTKDEIFLQGFWKVSWKDRNISKIFPLKVSEISYVRALNLQKGFMKGFWKIYLKWFQKSFLKDFYKWFRGIFLKYFYNISEVLPT